MIAHINFMEKNKEWDLTHSLLKKNNLVT
jgi:hypothetical protein